MIPRSSCPSDIPDSVPEVVAKALAPLQWVYDHYPNRHPDIASDILCGFLLRLAAAVPTCSRTSDDRLRGFEVNIVQVTFGRMRNHAIKAAISVTIAAALVACSADQPARTESVDKTASQRIAPDDNDVTGKPKPYFNQLYDLLTANVRYPDEAVRKGEQGSCSIRITFKRTGEIENTELVQSSGYRDLDAECLAAVDRIGAFPPIPANAAPHDAEFKVALPLNFVLPKGPPQAK